MVALSRTMGKLAQQYASGRDPRVTQVPSDAAKPCCVSRSPSPWTHQASCSPRLRLSCSVSVRLGFPRNAMSRFTNALQHDHTRGGDCERTSRSAQGRFLHLQALGTAPPPPQSPSPQQPSPLGRGAGSGLVRPPGLPPALPAKGSPSGPPPTLPSHLSPQVRCGHLKRAACKTRHLCQIKLPVST